MEENKKTKGDEPSMLWDALYPMIKEARKDRGYTQQQVADYLQLKTVHHYCNLENGVKTPSLRLLEDIIYFFDIEISIKQGESEQM